MIEMSSTFLRALIYNVSYNTISFPSVFDRRPPASSSIARPLLSLKLSLSLLKPDCYLSLSVPDSLGTHRRCVRLCTVVAYMHLTTRYAPPLRAVTHPRCVHASHDPVSTVVACRYELSLRTCTSRPGTHRRCLR